MQDCIDIQNHDVIERIKKVKDQYEARQRRLFSLDAILPHIIEATNKGWSSLLIATDSYSSRINQIDPDHYEISAIWLRDIPEPKFKWFWEREYKPDWETTTPEYRNLEETFANAGLNLCFSYTYLGPGWWVKSVWVKW